MKNIYFNMKHRFFLKDLHDTDNNALNLKRDTIKKGILDKNEYSDFTILCLFTSLILFCFFILASQDLNILLSYDFNFMSKTNLVLQFIMLTGLSIYVFYLYVLGKNLIDTIGEHYESKWKLRMIDNELDNRKIDEDYPTITLPQIVFKEHISQ